MLTNHVPWNNRLYLYYLFVQKAPQNITKKKNNSKDMKNKLFNSVLQDQNDPT